MSRVIRDVRSCLVSVCQQYIAMPTDPGNLQNNMQGFHNTANFSNVVGAIDCTHIKIKAPSIAEHFFVNRKNYHSITIQGVCDANMKFLNIVAKWQGSTHDALIWANSNLREMFENHTIPNGWLLGDSGYPLRPWLMTRSKSSDKTATEV